ncbi:GTP diphosphokinase, partial [Listeria seeligeri FSL S4-171]
LTSKHSYGPSRDWLKLVQTSQARNKIKQFFKRQAKEENVEKGRDLVEKEIRQLGFEPKKIMLPENLRKLADKLNFSHEDDLFAAVGYNGITALQVANRLTEKLRKEK